MINRIKEYLTHTLKSFVSICLNFFTSIKSIPHIISNICSATLQTRFIFTTFRWLTITILFFYLLLVVFHTNSKMIFSKFCSTHLGSNLVFTYLLINLSDIIIWALLVLKVPPPSKHYY